MRLACQHGDLLLINILIKKHIKSWDDGLLGACEGGHVAAALLMQAHGAQNYNIAFQKAYEAGHTHIAPALAAARPDMQINYDVAAIIGSCESGNLEDIKSLIACGTSLSFVCVELACQKGHRHIVQYFVDNYNCWWDMGLRGACSGGHMDIIQQMIDKGARDWEVGLQEACRSGHIDAARRMIECGACEYTSGLYTACQGGHIEIAKLMIEMGVAIQRTALRHAFIGGNMECVKLLMVHGANDWNNAIHVACFSGNIAIVQLAIDKGVNLPSSVSQAHDGEFMDICDLLVSHGVPSCKCKRCMVMRAMKLIL